MSLSTIAVASSLLLLLHFARSWFKSSNSSIEFPSAGSWPILRSIESLSQGKIILQNTYHKQLQDNRVYKLYGIFGNSFVLPPSMLPWLTSQPESNLSAKWAQMDALNIPITFLRPEIGLDPIHEPLVRRNLTANLDSIAGDLWEEVGLALADTWGQDTQDWHEINLDSTIRRVVARASSRIFVGKRLARDADYIESSIRYVSQVSTFGLLLSLFPMRMRHALGVFFTLPIKTSFSRCSKHLLPFFSALVNNKASYEPTHSSFAMDTPSPSLTSSRRFSDWLVSNSTKLPPSSPERTPDYLSRRIMALNFAAIHTSTMTITNLLLDVFSQSDTVSLLRDEALANGSTYQDTWNHARLVQMSRLDSALRESLRIWGLVAKAMSRKVICPGGIELPSGQHLPQGATVCVSGWGLHHDEAVYPDASSFVHDRFLRGNAGDKDHGTAAKTGDSFAAWGIGKHACPGRYFAVDLVKIVVMRVLLEYEVKALGSRQDNIWIEYNVIPPPTAKLSIRKRQAAGL